MMYTRFSRQKRAPSPAPLAQAESQPGQTLHGTVIALIAMKIRVSNRRCRRRCLAGSCFKASERQRSVAAIPVTRLPFCCVALPNRVCLIDRLRSALCFN